MSKPNNTPAPATVNLAGKTATEMRELLTDKAVTAATVIAFLSAKEKLRAPSAALLAELTGTAPAPVKAESKPVVKAEAPAPALDSGILARLAALELAVAALVEAVVKAEAPAPAPVKPVAAKPVVAAVPTPVVFAPAPVKPVVVKAEAPAPVKVASKRQEPPAKAPVHTEAEMRSALRGCATADLRTEAVGSGIEGAASMNKGALIDALVGLVLAEQQMVASPTPVTPAVDAPKRGKPDLRVVKQAEVEF